MSKLIDAMKAVNDLNRTHGVTQRGGKKYTEVFVRVEQFRMAYGDDLGINTEILVDDGKRVVVKATVINGLKIIGSGMAEEIRGSSNVNKTSALENCETSAIGRALASLGLHGGSYASANEIAAVSRKEQAIKEPAPVRKNPDISVHPLEPDEPEEQSTKANDMLTIYAHTGTELGTYDYNDYAMKLTEMFNVYVKRHTNKEGQPVSPRERMTFLRELKEKNQEGIDMLGENLMEQIDKAYLKSLRVLGAKEREENNA